MKNLINVALGKVKAELVLKNANIVNVFTGEIENGDVAISEGKIAGVGKDYQGEKEIDCTGKYVAPSYIDGHMHIESTQLTPLELAKAIIPRGTTTLIADPHEITNVCGLDGVEYIAKASKNLPLDVKIMLPSCVPATPFENSGAIVDSKLIAKNINKPYILGLGEFMNYPGVLNLDEDVIGKLETAEKYNKVVDGHAPNTSGKGLNAYICGGIKTDHECVTLEEIKEKIGKGMYVHLREGSATKNLVKNCKAVNEKNMRRFILCTDDRHACDLKKGGHIDNGLRLLVENGISPIWAITMATLNTAECYGLKNKGAIAPNYVADIVVLENLENFNAEYVLKDGKIVAENGKPLFKGKQYISKKVISTVHIKEVKESDFDLYSKSENVKVIRLLHNNVVTEKLVRKVKLDNGKVNIKDTDLLKLSVIERHKGTGNIGLGLIEGYGLKNGAIALTVSHDSHNIIILGDNNKDMLLAVKEIERIGGGMVLIKDGVIIDSLPLEIAGLMSRLPIDKFEKRLNKMIKEAYDMGVSKDIQPFMSLSFLALVVIPELKITDRGLFDVTSFSFTGIEA